MGFVVYNTSTDLVDSIRITQADADTRASESTLLSAYQGSVTVPRWVEPGVSYFDPDTAEFEEERELAIGGLIALKQAVRETHQAFYGEVYPRIQLYGTDYPADLKAKVEDVILGAKKAFYIRVRNFTYSHDRRQDYAEKVLLGPSSITGHGTATATIKLFNAVAGASLTGWTRGDPLEWLVWDAADQEYDRRSLADSITSNLTNFPSASNPDFDNIDLVSESWIDSLNASVPGR